MIFVEDDKLNESRKVKKLKEVENLFEGFDQVKSKAEKIRWSVSNRLCVFGQSTVGVVLGFC